jgi:hypothetical protein
VHEHIDGTVSTLDDASGDDEWGCLEHRAHMRIDICHPKIGHKMPEGPKVA